MDESDELLLRRLQKETQQSGMQEMIDYTRELEDLLDFEESDESVEVNNVRTVASNTTR